MKIYCNTCEMNISRDTLIAQFSDSDPACPVCGNNDFSDADDFPAHGQTEKEWHDEMMVEIQRHGGGG